MAYINDSAFDAALGWINTNGTRLDICSSEPGSYASVSGVSLGNKTGLTIGAAEDGDSNGRKVVVPAISDGTVTGDGTATHYAITNGSDTLVATGALAASKAVVTANPFELAAFSLSIADAA